jgi:flagellar basal body-associated protein FliL
MHKSNWPLIVVVLLVAVPVAHGFDGNGEKGGANKTNKPAKETPKAPVTPEMEAEAVNLVKQNHPELVELLHQLKTTNQTQYQQAVRDLSRAATTLANTEKNDPKKYVLDLKAWQVNSQIQVLAARYAMSPSPELKEEIKGKLVEQIDLRLEQQKLDRERTAGRLSRLDESISKLQDSREQEAQKALDKLTKASTQKSATRKESKGAASGQKRDSADKPGSPKK